MIWQSLSAFLAQLIGQLKILVFAWEMALKSGHGFLNSVSTPFFFNKLLQSGRGSQENLEISETANAQTNG